MKHFSRKIFFVLAALLFLQGCQHDDLCPATTQTTSLLVIRFYDVNDRESAQAPINLSIKAVNKDTAYLNRINKDSIAIPLRTDENKTQYEFTLNAPAAGQPSENQSIPTNTDVMTFNYGREQVYLNRACSYKVNYVDLKVSVDEGEDGGWIKDFVIEKTNIEDESSAHINIYY